MITSRIKVGHPERLFRYGDEDEKKMQVQFARLCVLYDDLTLEFTAANEDAIPLLDKSGRDNRRFYFVRRTLGTLSELRGAIGALEKSTTFQARKAAWEHGAQKEWSEAAKFFDTNHKFLKDWRNDVGGHVHDSAAAFAPACTPDLARERPVPDRRRRLARAHARSLNESVDGMQTLDTDS